VRRRTHPHALAGIVLLAALAGDGIVHAQESLPPPSDSSSPSALIEQETTTQIAPECVEPPPLVSLEDYDGPLKKTVGLFARELERKSVHPPHYKPGLMLCSLDLKDKFFLFARDTFNPVTFIASSFFAGLDQAQNRDPSFGQGSTGYAKRFGASFADQASFKFFRDFAYPTIFSEDPRYYRLGQGQNSRRVWHAVSHAFVARRDNGNRMFNFSEWLGTVSVVALSNAYHPGNQRGFAPAATQVGYGLVEDIGLDVLREFWPETARKFKLPFRAETPGGDFETPPATE
jgi:hypothetical protein